MAPRPDYDSLIAGHTVVIDMINAGEQGLPVLGRLLEVLETSTGAIGTAFVEYGPQGGRTVAATGVIAWARGRPVPHTEPPTAPPGGDRVRLVPAGALPAEFAGRGLGPMLVTRAEIAGRLVGVLHTVHPAGTEPRAADHEPVLSYVAACVAQLYADRPTPSAHGEGCAHDRDLHLAMTSHELRTPVTVIKGYADTLTRHWDSLDETERRRAAEVIGERAGELARLVDRLLAATAAAEPRPCDGTPRAYDLVAALRDAVREVPAELRERIDLELPAKLPAVLGDPATPAIVLTELLTNAAKYSDCDTPVQIRAAAEGQRVIFTVADRGVGIRPEHLERAFDRFWQGESGDRRRFPGTGLGLYLVRRIVERQNGWVSLRPRPGGGTVAEVRLPSRRAIEEAADGRHRGRA